MAQIAGRLLHVPVGDEGADIGGAHDPPVQSNGLDDVAAYPLLLAIGLELFRRALAPVAETEIMSHHDPGKPQLVNDGIGKFLPGHVHHAPIEVDENHIVDAVAAPDDLLSAKGAVDKRDILA